MLCPVKDLGGSVFIGDAILDESSVGTTSEVRGMICFLASLIGNHIVCIIS